MPARPALAPLLVGVLLAGCTVGPNFTPPSPPTDQAYDAARAAPHAVAGEPAQRLAIGERITGDWWTLYRSPALDTILKQAIARNRDLAAARANLAAAQNIAAAARGALFPQLDFAASAERQKISFAAFGLKQPPATFNVFSVGPTVSYSLDPFGRNRRLVEERQAQADIERYQLTAAYLAVTGNAVTDTIGIAAINAQIAAVDDVVADDQNLLALVQRSVEAGGATDLDIESARSQLATDRTLLPPLQQRLSVARHVLTVLVAQTPGTWTAPDFTLASLTLPADVPVSLPSALVHQRPDILAAEAELHAASASVGVAAAQLYPDITLTATVEQIGLAPHTLLTAGDNVWNFGAGVTTPLFHGGALRAQERAAEDNFDSARATYQQVVLQSFAQVADTLDALAHDTRLLGEQRAALDSSRRSLDLTRRAYQAGDVALLQVLDASRLYQRARLGYAQAEAQRYVDTAQLFLAMGGGWWERGDLTQAAPEPNRPMAH
ncbi:MAG TPA: efflux transporter outer membrane subunit [Stellaceae bacterium]|nr:efflux transporter outer membrane subunit [Stellaceae bacterium]